MSQPNPEQTPYLAGFAITGGPSLGALMDRLMSRPSQVISFSLEAHDKLRGEPGGTLLCVLVSLSVPDQDGMRRIEMFDGIGRHWNFRYVGYYNPESGLGWVSRERVPKPWPPAGPIEFLIGNTVHILGQTPES